MCGVIGYAARRSSAHHAAWVRALCWESRVRGLHAFGSAMWNGFLRWNYSSDAKAWADLADINMQTGPSALIAHARYSTSGDWREPENNQPLVSRENEIALVCNGTIDMGTKAEMEQRWAVALRTANDSELVLQDLCLSRDPLGRLDQARGSFAGCWLKRGHLFAMRNSKRPLWRWLPEPETVLVASTQDIFLRAIPESRPMPLAERTTYHLNPWTD